MYSLPTGSIIRQSTAHANFPMESIPGQKESLQIQFIHSIGVPNGPCTASTGQNIASTYLPMTANLQKVSSKEKDYEVSYGATYYDSTWGGGKGAMMEFYKDRSLPIFPMDNKYTSAFISLGDDAYYLTWPDRPKGMPPISHFSELNHPPRRDFIKHLPYSKSDSEQLNGKIQGYSFWTSPRGINPPGPPVQTGVSPDRTNDGCIMFGYGFDSDWTEDEFDKDHAPYRHPNSFYFSGCPVLPSNPKELYAPMVSQNYTKFIAKRPDPAETWDLVEKFAQGQPIPFYNPFVPKSSNDTDILSSSKKAKGIQLWDGQGIDSEE